MFLRVVLLLNYDDSLSRAIAHFHQVDASVQFASDGLWTSFQVEHLDCLFRCTLNDDTAVADIHANLVGFALIDAFAVFDDVTEISPNVP